MPIYSFPGKLDVPAYCNNKKKCEPFTLIKSCPPKPFIKDTACKPNVYDRAIVRYVDKCDCHDSGILLEAFSGIFLDPVNIYKFCGRDIFKDGDIVAVEAEVDTCNTSAYTNALAVKLFTLKKVWKQEIRTATGTVSTAVDNNGITYHTLTEVYDPKGDNPYFKLTENSLLFNLYVITYDIFNIMGVSNLDETFAELEGKVISVVYTDYGTETKERSGIPIVITQYQMVQ